MSLVIIQPKETLLLLIFQNRNKIDVTNTNIGMT